MNKPKTKQELIQLCKDLKIKKYSSKTKDEIIHMLELHSQMQPSPPPPPPPIQEINPTLTLSETADDEVGKGGHSPPFNPRGYGGVAPASGRSGGDNIQITSQPLNLTSTANLRFADLFCGIGGFHQALKRINATCVFACDIDEKCRQIYKLNYGIEPHADIRTIQPITLPDFDILTGGFPCQSFSNSGKKRGLEDKRGQLFEYILDIATVKQPSLMFLENVKHIKKINNGEVFAHIISRIKETGYTVYTVELSPHQLGIPQHRERVVFVCIRQDLHKTTYTFPIPDNAPPMRFECIFETDSHITDKYKISKEEEQILNAWNEMVSVFDTGENLSPTILCNEFYKTYTEPEFNALPAWKKEYITKNQPIYHKYKKQWDDWREIHKDILTKKEVFSKLEWQAGKKKENDSIFNYFIQIRQSGIRVKKNNCFPTLVAIVQTPIYAKERRYITPRECARLQSFPDNFVFHKNDHTAYKQFGNSVNVDVMHYIISQTLQQYHQNENNSPNSLS